MCRRHFIRFRCLWIVLLAAAVLPACQGRSGPEGQKDEEPQGPPLFRDLTATSGIAFTYRNGEEANHYTILESLGGGVALIDYDGDGLLDIFLPGGGGFAGPDNKRIIGHPCKLYRNRGKFQFQDVTAEVGLDRGPVFYSHGVAVADFNRDGWPDLLVTGWGRMDLYRNDPVDPKDPKKGRKFTEVSKEMGLPEGLWTTSAAWADLDGDGFPDLYVCHYVDWSFKNHPTDCTYDGKTRDVCPPKSFSALPHRLFRNNGGNSFTDVSKEAGLRSDGKGLGVLAVDINADGKPDIYVANDTTDNFLYVNHSRPGHISLKETGVWSGVAVDDRSQPNGSMGVDAADYDGSGRPSLFVTNYEEEWHALYRNLGGGSFLYSTPTSGIGLLGRRFVGFGTAFLDVDHDGREDLVIANGHVIRHPARSERKQRPVLLRNQGGGKFADISSQGGSYFEGQYLGRGLAAGDLDNDGRIDLVFNNVNAPAAVLRNEANIGNHWLGIELVGKGNRDVVGARVVLEGGGRKQTRFARGGGSYCSSGDRRLVFGLGKRERVDRLTVFWPWGQEQVWTGLKAEGYWRLVEGEKEPQRR